jgi:hypothetical protein
MKLWLMVRTDNVGYDEYDEAVVAAETEFAARNIHPSRIIRYVWRDGWVSPNDPAWNDDSWAPPSSLKVTEIGDAAPAISAGVICHSFNAG